jgi:hypothetical protein
MSEGQQIPAEASYHVEGADPPKGLPHGAAPTPAGPQPHVGSLPDIPSPSGGRTQEFERGLGEQKQAAGRSEPAEGPEGATGEAAGAGSELAEAAEALI